MVLDKEGRWWAKSAKTGEWKYHDGNEWVPGAPPGYEPPAAAASETDEVNAGESEALPPDGTAREFVDGDEERSSGVSFRRPVLIAAFLLVVLLAGGGYIITRGMTLTSGGGMSGSGGSVDVPDLVGYSSVEEARDAAGGDFEVVEGDGVESEEPIGAVVSQEPSSGEQAAPDSTIYVDVGKGVGVPDVEGNTRDEAARTLEDAGFEVEVEADKSSGEDEGKVVAQEPRAEKSAEAGSSVEITVGEGPGEGEEPGDGGGSGGGGGGVVENPEPEAAPPVDSRIPVPDVIGESVEEAERTLEDAGFSTDTEYVESGLAAGTVVATDPDPGSLLDPSTGKVDIEASLGPPETAPESPPKAPPESPPDEQYEPPEGEH